jgi:hypothetical protein
MEAVQAGNRENKLIAGFIYVPSEGEEGSEYRLSEDGSNSDSFKEVNLTTSRHR